MICLEICPRVGHQLFVCGVINCLNAGNVLNQRLLIAVYVLDQLGLGIRRTSDQDLVDAGKRERDTVEIVLIFGGVPRPDAVGFMVQVMRWVFRMNDNAAGAFPVEMKDACFAMIDPNDGVLCIGHR